MSYTVECSVCEGSGTMKCSHCDGTGHVEYDGEECECSYCDKGKKWCFYCNGQGYKEVGIW